MVGLGSTFAFPFLQGLAERRGVGATRFTLQAGQHVEKFLVIPGSILVFAFGLALIFNDITGYSDDMPTWLHIAVVWFIVAFAVAAFYQPRNVKKALAALENVPDTAPLPDAYVAASKRIQMVGGLLGLSVIGITFLMTFKPGG